MKKFFYEPFHLFKILTVSTINYQYKNFLRKAVVTIACLFIAGISYAQQGQALDFTGSGEYVQLPATIVSGSYTKEAWINTNSLTGFPNILSGTGTALFLNNGRLAAGHAPSFGQLLDTNTTSPIVAGTWYHVAVTYDSVLNELKLYKNGVLIADTIDLSTPGYTETALSIGTFAGGNYWDGEIDEVSIWSVALSQATIDANMNCALTGDEPFLIAYYNFNEGIAGGTNTGVTTLGDSSDKCTHYDGTLQNFALTGLTSNWVAPGAPLSGGCANIYPNINVTGNSTCITDGESAPSVTDSTDFGIYGVTPITTTFAIENTGGADLTISNVTITGANAPDFSIAGLTSTTISAGDTAYLLITFLPTDNLGLKSATVTINNNDSDEDTFAFAIQGTNSGPGRSLAFNGLNNFVALQNITLSGSYTKEAWINTSTVGGFPNILSGTGTALFLNNGMLAAGHAPSFGQLLDTTTLNLITINTWHHVAVTYDSTTGEMSLYKDGVLVADSMAVPTYTEPALFIGTFAGGNYWFGKIDEVRIWNIARTAKEIADNMNCMLHGTETGLLAYYNFNNGIAGSDNTMNPAYSILPDITSNHFDGQLMNFDLMGTVSNWVSDSPTLAGSCLVLPVSLQSFSGRIDGSVVKLTWQTSMELNNKGFDILRSADGVSNWIKIGYVGASYLGASNTYNFTDALPLQGANFYRLKQVDMNGDSKLSQVVVLKYSIKAPEITIYPNPAKDNVSLTFTDNKLMNTVVQLSTVTGKIISKINLTANYQQIDLSNLSKGVYVLSFSNGEVRRLLKE
jgi:hypothetical protein